MSVTSSLLQHPQIVDNQISELLPGYEPSPLDTSRGGYTLTMRECCGTREVLDRLGREQPASGKPQRLHVGWGSFRNLDIAGVRKSAAVVLLDINIHQFRIWEAVSAALKTSSSPAEFIDTVVPRLPVNPRLRQFNPDTHAWLSSDLTRPGSWLSDQQRFSWIKDLFGRGQVAGYCLDIRGGVNPQGDLFRQFRSTLKKGGERYGLCADTLYLTNLPWMMKEELGFFGEAHREFSVAGPANAADAVLRNLTEIAPLFSHLITASKLAADSQADNLRWKTECFRPADWLRDYL